METLNLYLDTILPKPIKEPKTCCNPENIILSQNLLLYVCVECGLVQKDKSYHIDYYDKYKNPNIVKTYIGYSGNKNRHLQRLSKWQNYSYHEVQMSKLLKEIDTIMVGYDNDIVNFTKINFKNIYQNISIRAKIKDSLIVYCIYKTHLMLKKEIEIDDLFTLLNISGKNYNDLNKRLSTDRLFYLKIMNEYIEKTDMKINKNNLIRIYNIFMEKNDRKFNNKSIILGIIHYILSQDETNDIKKFHKKFNISKSSLVNVRKFIIENKII